MNALNERHVHAHVLDLQAGVAHLQSICGDDPDLLADMIEGELSVEALLSKLVAMITEDEASALGLKLYRDKVSNRKKRLDERARRLRVLLASVVNNLPSRRFRNELASVRVFDIEPAVIVVEEADVPVRFWKQAEPVIDLPAIRRHLNARRKLLDRLSDCQTSAERAQRLAEIDCLFPEVPGCHLDNGDLSVSITVA
jgi:Siphovirus Gp157